MSLCANGTPDKLTKEDLKQPDQIKVSFEKGTKEITGHVAPDQAWFGAEYFLAYTLPDFKSKILTWLLDAQKDNGPLLFSLLGQCFQDVGLTKRISVIAKRCPNNADHTKANFDECIRDYLEAVAGFPNIGNQLICWLCTTKKPTLMPMHEFMRRRVQLLSYLESDYLRWTMDVPTAQEKSEQIFFPQPKAHQNKFANLNKTVPSSLLRMIAFFEQCQATNKAAGILDKIGDKKQLKEKKTAHVPTPSSRESSYHQHHSHNYRDYHQSDQHNCNDHQPDYHHWDNRHNPHQRDDKDSKSSKSYDKKDDCKRNYSKKKSNEAMHNDQSSKSSAGNSSGKRSQSCSRSSLPSWSWSCSCSSSQSYDNHHVN
jgi:hypothetical protein